MGNAELFVVVEYHTLMRGCESVALPLGIIVNELLTAKDAVNTSVVNGIV
jgi:hypothetical protein